MAELSFSVHDCSIRICDLSSSTVHSWFLKKVILVVQSAWDNWSVSIFNTNVYSVKYNRGVDLSESQLGTS